MAERMHQAYSIDRDTMQDLAKIAKQGEDEQCEHAASIGIDANGKIVKHDLLDTLDQSSDHVAFDQAHFAAHKARNEKENLSTSIFHNHPNGSLIASAEDKKVFAQAWGHHPIMTVCKNTGRTLLGLFDEKGDLAEISVGNTSGKVLAIDASGTIEALEEKEAQAYTQAA